MEPYTLVTMAEMRRRELTADAGQRRDAVRVRRAARMRDPLNTLSRVQVIRWIAVARLRRAAIETARGAR